MAGLPGMDSAGGGRGARAARGRVSGCAGRGLTSRRLTAAAGYPSLATGGAARRRHNQPCFFERARTQTHAPDAGAEAADGGAGEANQRPRPWRGEVVGRGTEGRSGREGRRESERVNEESGYATGERGRGGRARYKQGEGEGDKGTSHSMAPRRRRPETGPCLPLKQTASIVVGHEPLNGARLVRVCPRRTSVRKRYGHEKL